MKQLTSILYLISFFSLLAACSQDNQNPNAFSSNVDEASQLIDTGSKEQDQTVKQEQEHNLTLQATVSDNYVALSWALTGTAEQFQLIVSSQEGDETFYTDGLSYGYVTNGIQEYQFEVVALSQENAELAKSNQLSLISSEDQSNQSDRAP